MPLEASVVARQGRAGGHAIKRRTARGKVLFWRGGLTYPRTQTTWQLPVNAIPDRAVLVACLCAEWCGVCRDYRSVFEQVRARFPQARFVWVDVEDQADLVDPIDVDDFPTLLIAVGDEARFLGTLTPQAEMLDRLVRDRSVTATRAGPALPDADALVRKLRAGLR